MRPSSSLASVTLTVAAFGLSGCAAAPPVMEPSTAPPPRAVAREVSPPDTEMLAIARAEEEIDRLFPDRSRRVGGPRKAGPADDTKLDKDAKPQDAAGEQRAAGASGDSCTTACRALGAMASSADRLCRLAGENDGRCDDARARVRGASTRVKASCPACVVAPTAAPPISAPPRPVLPTGPAPGMPGGTSPVQ